MSDTPTTPVTDLVDITIDASDAIALARFHAALAGGEVTEYPDYQAAQVTLGPYVLNFQQVADYQAPRWPGQQHPQQFHLDYRVSELAEAVRHAESLGATRAAEQPGGDAYTVMLDPDGHPFCLCPPAQG